MIRSKVAQLCNYFDDSINQGNREVLNLYDFYYELSREFVNYSPCSFTAVTVTIANYSKESYINTVLVKKAMSWGILRRLPLAQKYNRPTPRVPGREAFSSSL
jgi:hypothetical protein